MGFGQESDVAFAEGMRSTVRHQLGFPPQLLCFALLGSCVRGEIITSGYASENVTGSLPLWRGWRRTTEIGNMLLDVFLLGKLFSISLTYVTFGTNLGFFS